MKLVYIVGARPNFVKMAPVISALRHRLPDEDHVVVHTGQHYDPEMSELFLDELGMPEPAYRLNVGSGSHADQTGRIMVALEDVLAALGSAFVFVPGDVNSALAAALVCAKLGVPYAHVESGLRSFDRSMPEEINRIVADEFAELLFAHSEDAVTNLAAEGIRDHRVHLVGNTMIDSLIRFEPLFRARRAAATFGLEVGRFVLVTLHRPALVDGEELQVVLDRLDELAESVPVLFPMHPRTRARVDPTQRRVLFVDPLGYLDFLSLQADCGAVLTDSGGVQEEATFLGVPCFTLRTTTERPITIRLGTNTLLGLDASRIQEVASALGRDRDSRVPPPLWDGHAADRIADIVVDHLAGKAEKVQSQHIRWTRL